MIVSHEHKFIFLKTRKTAGTSVEIALSAFCSTRDVLTPLEPADEHLRSEQSDTSAQNYDFPLRHYRIREWGRLARDGHRMSASSHMHADVVRRLVGRKVWNSYYKLAIVRNPWDAVISAYYWNYRDGAPPPMREFLNSDRSRGLRDNYRTFSIGGRVIADRLVRYEDLAAGLQCARAEIGLPSPLKLPHAKADVRKDRRHYRDVLDRADAETIGQFLAREIRLTGYEF